MSALRKTDNLSVADYLFYEQDSPVRHEYIDGELLAMVGGSDDHNVIAGNLFAALYQHLAEADCQPFINDMKVQVTDTVFYYPDVMVACDDPAKADRYVRKEPILLVEVTSPTTETMDRLKKLEAYQRIKSLKEYVIVAQDEVSVHVYRRLRNGIWQNEILTEMTAELVLKSVGLTLPLTQIYRRVAFPAKPKPKRKRHPNA